MNIIALNCSSLVGQQAGYQKNWSQSVAAVNEYYKPLDTFATRFEKMLQGIQALGFTAVDIWTAGQLNWSWATREHIAIASNLLKKSSFTVTSLGGEFGATREEFESACHLALGINTRLLSGTLPLLFTDRAFVIEKLRDYDLRLAIENHPERTPAEMLAKIGDGAAGRIGTSVDTGWYATQGYDAAQAILDLRDRLLHIHLKDVFAGEHVNCGYGKGIVPIERCLIMLKNIGYQGDISVENHAVDHDPTDELRTALDRVKQALA